MQTCSIKISVLRIILGASFLISLLMMMGCGQGFSGQATGEDAENIEVLKQEISDISDSLADLDTSIGNLESVKDTEDSHALEQEILGISNRIDNLSKSIAKVEDTLDVMNTSVTDLASLVEDVDQTKSSEAFGNAVGERGGNSGEIVQAAKSDTGKCNVSGEFQLSMKGFVFQSEAETFLEVAGDDRSTSGDVIGAIGEYERVGPFNDWHYGTISASGDNYLWTNRAGSSWTLYPDFTNDRFGTDTSNPYYNFPSNSPSRYFTILYDNPLCAD
jgi:prefoldin subunit 5